MASYHEVLAYLAASGQAWNRQASAELPQSIFATADGVEQLLRSMTAVAPATPGARDEEWNPLSQRPHAPLPPPVSGEFGQEVTALKEAVDAYTTLVHEMMHVALWEPLFSGQWAPRSRRQFVAFSLLAEGFCFFYSDIVVSGAVRVRLPDGEFALDRQTPSNARFHPVRAFDALGMTDHQAILEIYLDGFSGGRTALWQGRGGSPTSTATAVQVYDFYAGSVPYLREVYAALASFGLFGEFYRRFCALPGLPALSKLAPGEGLKAYFANYFCHALPQLAQVDERVLAGVRQRRMLQMRAYYGLQLRWLLREELVLGPGWTPAQGRRLVCQVASYLDGLEVLLRQLAAGEDVRSGLAELDAAYERYVRSQLVALDLWVAKRWLIAPSRAGGVLSAVPEPGRTLQQEKVKLMQTVTFLVDELAWQLREETTIAGRSAALVSLQRLASIGASLDTTNASALRRAGSQLRLELATPALLPLWSLPLASFDPVANTYRELVFSYQ